VLIVGFPVLVLGLVVVASVGWGVNVDGSSDPTVGRYVVDVGTSESNVRATVGALV
jgi:hypothetical protein